MTGRRPTRAAVGLVIGAALLAASACGPEATERPARTVPAPRVVDGADRLFPGERATLTGRIGPEGREVVLQRHDGAGWTEDSTTRTGERGRYSFDATGTTSGSRYRVVAPATERSGRRTSGAVVLRTIAPRASIEVHGAPVAQAPDDDRLRGARPLLPVAVSVRPARAVAVRVERRVGTTWRTVATGTTDARGRWWTGAPPTPSAEPLRAVVDPGRGAVPLTTRVVRPASPALTWSDDFDAASTYAAQWRTRLQEYGGGRMCAKPDPAMATLRPGVGVVRLRVERDRPRATRQCPYGTFKNAMIATRVEGFDSLSTTYGTFAARIKFQSGRGQHGAFWLQGPSITGAEIDTVEYYGDGRPDGGLSAGVHHTVGSKVTSEGGIYRTGKDFFGAGRTPSSGFHVYAVTWTPRGYTFRLDGRTVLSTRKPHVSAVDEFLVLSLLTSDWELPAMDLATLGTASTMEVDWVRVWQ